MQFDFAIIGGGLTATAMLCQFVSKVRAKSEKGHLDPSRIGIQVYEKQDTFGPGFPHSDKFVLPFHITNMCASDMGIFLNKPEDFQHWVAKNKDHLQSRFPWLNDFSYETGVMGHACNHYPRTIMGEYLRTRFQEAVQLAKQAGCEVSLYPQSEVIDLRRNDGKICLQIKDLASAKYFSNNADRVLLATGHWFEKKDQDRFFTSPWPAQELLRSIPEGGRIAVIGTSLSAIETLLTLTSEGEFIYSPTGTLVYVPPDNSRIFFLYSRRGLLPKVRGKMGNRKNTFLNRKNLDRLLSENRGNLTLDKIFKLLNSELKKAYGNTIDWEAILNPGGKPADLLQGYIDDAINGDGPHGELLWQTILHQSFDMIRSIYLNLTVEDRRQFEKKYTSVFFTHAAAQPSINAEKLLALMKAGIVEVIKLGKDYRLNRNEVKDYYEFSYRDIQGNLKRDAYRYVVDARGQKKSFETNPSELALNLIRSGTVQIEEIRSINQQVVPVQSSVSKLDTTDCIYKTGSIWIDPETHHIVQKGPDKKITISEAIYAVGAMTRGQIIDASMARGIVQATSRIADGLIYNLELMTVE